MPFARALSRKRATSGAAARLDERVAREHYDVDLESRVAGQSSVSCRTDSM